ncbi:MAG: hypothetical protein QXO02_07775 [Thermofilaceae archaeon]
MNQYKSVKKLVRSRKSWGADVEYIVFVPVFVAVESKRTTRQALDSSKQLADYAERYDALFLHVEDSRLSSEELSALKDLAGKHGAGILLGGSSADPLATAKLVSVAKLKIKSNLDPATTYLNSRESFKAELVVSGDLYEQIAQNSLIRKMLA